MQQGHELPRKHGASEGCVHARRPKRAVIQGIRDQQCTLLAQTSEAMTYLLAHHNDQQFWLPRCSVSPLEMLMASPSLVIQAQCRGKPARNNAGQSIEHLRRINTAELPGVVAQLVCIAAMKS